LNLSYQEQKAYHTEQIAKIYPEYYIIKVNQFDEVAKNTLDEWVNFLKKEEVSEHTKAKGLKEAKEKLDVLKLSKEEKKEYDSFISNWRDTESAMISNFIAGELQGEKTGELKSKREMAKKCLAEGMSMETIMKITGLPEDEVRNLNPLTK
jgi:predicted transposase/invertase (TIGR01784 family)